MKNSFRFAILSLLIIGGTSSISAQSYTSSIGFRLGEPLSASYKLFIAEDAAVEVFVSYKTSKTTVLATNYGWTRVGVGAAYQIHKEIGSTGGLMWYYGGGASVLYYNYSDDIFYSKYNNLSIGIQGNIGLDYAFDNIPINLSIDWVPTFFIKGYNDGFGAEYGALSIRYILD